MPTLPSVHLWNCTSMLLELIAEYSNCNSEVLSLALICSMNVNLVMFGAAINI